MSSRYSPEPINPSSDMRSIARQEAQAVIGSQSSLGLYAPKSIPWQAVDLPLVTVFPAAPEDRDEVNLYDDDDGTVSRWVWSKKFNAWLVIGGGPVGTVGVTALASPPPGALAADGSAVTSAYPRLRALLVAASNPYGTSGSDPLLPDLVNNFIVGAGDTYALGATGGAATVTLATTNLPAHTHSISSGGSHSHTPLSGGGGDRFVDALGGTTANITTGGGGYTLSATTASSGSHDHGGATGSAGSGTAHDNLPPYVALTPFIWT